VGYPVARLEGARERDEVGELWVLPLAQLEQLVVVEVLALPVAVVAPAERQLEAERLLRQPHVLRLAHWVDSEKFRRVDGLDHKSRTAA